MATLSLFVVFMNADPQGRVRMNCVGAREDEDIERLGVRLVDGLKVIVYDEEHETDAEVLHSKDEGIWVAKIDWKALRPVRNIAIHTS